MGNSHTPLLGDIAAGLPRQAVRIDYSALIGTSVSPDDFCESGRSASSNASSPRRAVIKIEEVMVDLPVLESRAAKPQQPKRSASHVDVRNAQAAPAKAQPNTRSHRRFASESVITSNPKIRPADWSVYYNDDGVSEGDDEEIPLAQILKKR